MYVCLISIIFMIFDLLVVDTWRWSWEGLTRLSSSYDDSGGQTSGPKVCQPLPLAQGRAGANSPGNTQRGVFPALLSSIGLGRGESAALPSWGNLDSLGFSRQRSRWGLPGCLGGEVEFYLLSSLRSRSRPSIWMVKTMSESRCVRSSRYASSFFTSSDIPCRNMSNSASGFQALSAANVQKSKT